MKVAFVLSALFTSVDANLKIVGGKEAVVGQHLYVTGIRSSASGIDSCGGSLIAPNVVLTAAHCMGHGLKYVAIGSHYNSGTKDGEQITIKQEIKHPKYNKKTSSYDFGVYILERDSKFPVVEVSFDNVEADTPTVVRGWGTTSSAGSPSKVLLEVGVDVVNQEQCIKWLSGHTGVDGFSVDDSMLCSGGKEGEDACQGDSGGPLTVEIGGSEKLVGVVSWGLKCAEKNKPGVYSRISMARDFIEPYLKNSPTSTPGTTSAPGPTKPTTKPNITTKKPATVYPKPGSWLCQTYHVPNATTKKPTTAYPKPGCAKPTTVPNATTMNPTTASPYTTSGPYPTKPTTSAPGPTKRTTMPNITTKKPTTAYPKPGCATCGVCYYPGDDYCLDDFSKDDCEYYSPTHGTLWCGN
ncbi:hypothetical protein DYB38_011536 [Aphanomyces astaci]|uniref:Peptidase S1 domain-containing protein n=1 Tax=Aphanomyces astaci TaxID=112090 RepID=A0A397CIZ5_APHAT|nr:hypothetical protein DYB38_011536 [Aphanomyces astaci]RHY48919.1 hypothetical protein DYB34_009539 [Aphanomyces astaci]